MNILLITGTFLKNMAIWIWNNKKAAFYIIIALAIMSLTKCNYDKSNKIEQLTTEKNGLASKLQSQVTSGSGQVKIVYRDKDRIIEKIQYLPPEGFITVEQLNQVKQDQKSFLDKLKEKLSSGNATLEDIKNFILGTTINTGDEIITVHDRGICVRPGFFLGFDGQYNNYPVNAGLDCKLLFFQRWSSGIGSTVNYPTVWFSRHVDDCIPWLNFQNVEIMAGYGKPYKEFDKSVLIIGARSNF